MKNFAVLMVGWAGLVLSPQALPAATVYNGGFELGDFTGWILSGNPIPGSVDTSMPHTGSYAATLFADSSLGYIEQQVETIPGASYNLLYFLASDGGMPNQFLAQVDGKTLLQGYFPASGYIPYSLPFQATGAMTTIKFGFRDDPGALHLDDVSVTAASPAVPEPNVAWAGLLALSSFLFWRRVRSNGGSL